MSKKYNLITERIRHKREAPADQPNELEFALRQQPRRWFMDHLPKALGSPKRSAPAFSASVLLAFVAADRRTRLYSSTGWVELDGFSARFGLIDSAFA